MVPLRELIEQLHTVLAREDVLRDIQGVSGRMLQLTGQLAHVLWRAYRNAPNADALWHAVWSLEAFEEQLEETPAPELRDDEGDLIHFEFYGRKTDMLRMGTWTTLDARRGEIAGRQLPPAVQSVLDMSFGEARDRRPPPLERPPSFDAQQGAAEISRLIAEWSQRS